MTVGDKFNIVGIVLTGLGSTIAMVGIYKQTNGYFAFKSSDFFNQAFRILWKFVGKGRSAAIKQLQVAAALGKAKGEDRTKTLIGFYFVLFGFMLQMLGSACLLLALFAHP
jgi:hypothetical protein